MAKEPALDVDVAIGGSTSTPPRALPEHPFEGERPQRHCAGEDRWALARFLLPALVGGRRIAETANGGRACRARQRS